MKKLVFICHGNAFRSPVAEALFNYNPKEGWMAYSCGTLVKEENIQGETMLEISPSLEVVIKTMKNRGINVSMKHSDRLFPEFLEDADKVIVMSEEEYTPDWLSDREDERWEVPNPEILNEEIVENIINILSKKIEELKNRM